MNKTIKIDGLHIFYQEHGNKGKTIVLLHGWGQSNAFWKDVLEKFSPNYHLYALDLPGFGVSQEPPHSWDIFRYSLFVNHFIEALHIKNPILIGHSFGGRIAIAYASSFPIDKLILYSTGGGMPEPSLFKKVNRYIVVNIGKILFPNLLYKYHTVLFRPNHYKNKIIVNKKRSQRMLDIYAKVPSNLEHVSRKIQVKTLIISGLNDFITNPRIGHMLQRNISQSKLLEVEKATHFAHLEAPEIFYKEVRKFLTEN